MKIYYYAFTGHKFGLDRARRAAAVLNKLREKGMDTMLLVNDFRAGLATRDLGVPESISIEGIQDIDAVAEIGDVVIIDSPEDDHGRLVKYCSDFKQVFRFAEHDDDKSIHGEIMLTVDAKLDAKDENSISSVIVDDLYCKEHKKEKRKLFFLGDSDADKIILNNANFFKEANMELLLGHYFYIKYEDDLAKIFTTLHESDDYVDLICSSSHIITASYQTALEASSTGAKVTFIELKTLTSKQKELFKLLDVIIIIGFNDEIYRELSEEKGLISKTNNSVNVGNNDKIIDEIMNSL